VEHRDDARGQRGRIAGAGHRQASRWNSTGSPAASSGRGPR
jgi:hypothetical protein